MAAAAEEQPPEMADGGADGEDQPMPDIDDPPISIGPQGEDYVRYVLATCMMSDVVVAQGFFAGVDPVAELLRLLEVAQGRDEATARDNVARSQAIRRLRREDPELLRRTSVTGLDGHDNWERWQRLLDRLEAEGVEREVWVCCRQEPLRWRAPLREDGKAAPVRVPLLPSLDAAEGEVWGRGEVREATRQARYAEAARADGAPGAPVHGSVLLRLASDFLCYKCQKDFVRVRGGGDVLPDEEVAAWWKRLQFKTKMPGLADARNYV